MRATFTFYEPHHFPPAALARLLVDIEGIVLMAALLADKWMVYEWYKVPIEEYGYENLIFLSGNPELRAAHFPWLDKKGVYYKVELRRVTYHSPPKINISVYASLDVQKTVKTIFDFIIFILTLKEKRALEKARAEGERQDIISREIANYRDLAALLSEIEDPDLRDRIEEALVKRIDPLVGTEDYPELKQINIRGPFG